MRILIHGINFSPELTGIGKYTGEMAEWMAEHGHEVRVVTALPYYPQWRVGQGYHAWQFRHERIKQVDVYRCPLWVPAQPSGMKRVLHLASFALSSFPVMLWQIFWRPDVVLVIEPPLFCAPQAYLVAKLSGARAWLHIQDYEVDAAFDLDLLKGKMLRRIVAACERWLMRRFDRVSTISQRMADRALDKGVESERLILFPNWVDVEAISPNQEQGSGSYRIELGIAADAVVALYSGNMGGKQGLEILAQAAVLLRDAPNVLFVLCGNGAGRADLTALCGSLPNVRFMDLQPQERLSELLAMADIHLLPQRANAAGLVMPSKLTGMMASGRPVVATAHKGTELACVVAGCGLVVEPEQPQAFADAIQQLAVDASLRDTLGTAGRKYAVANLDRDRILNDFESELCALLQPQA